MHREEFQWMIKRNHHHHPEEHEVLENVGEEH
jgi:hypothetical protein